MLVLVIGMFGVQLQIDLQLLPKEGKIWSKCEAQGQNLVLLVMTSDLFVIVIPTFRLLGDWEPNCLMSILLVLRLLNFI